MKALRRVSISSGVAAVDHVGVIGGDLVVQALGRMGE
jgi:hypothetical protein